MLLGKTTATFGGLRKQPKPLQIAGDHSLTVEGRQKAVRQAQLAAYRAKRSAPDNAPKPVD